jgi:peptidoglycan/xylan/chitin deacetylase (PgdA/CDA1 family)
MCSVVKSEIYMMCEREGEIAFTYDQGPSQYTGRLLVTLAKHKVKATFHISPDYLDNPVILAYLRKAAMDGHLIGIFVKEEVTADSIKDYLGRASGAIQRYTNYKPQFLRFPAPGPSEEMLKAVTGMGYIVTTYNLDSQDYNAVNVPVDGNESVFNVYKDVLDQILPPAKGSFIAIQRDIVQASVEQSDQIIQYALDKGYKAVRLDQCIRKPQKGDDSSSSGDKKDKDEGKPGKPTRKNEPSTPNNPSISHEDPVHKLETSNNSANKIEIDSLLMVITTLSMILFLFK